MALFIFSLVLFIGAIVVGISIIKTDKETFYSMFYGAACMVMLISVIFNGIDAFMAKKEYTHFAEIKSYKVDTTYTTTNGIQTDTIYTLYYK